MTDTKDDHPCGEIYVVFTYNAGILAFDRERDKAIEKAKTISTVFPYHHTTINVAKMDLNEIIVVDTASSTVFKPGSFQTFVDGKEMRS